MHKGHYVNSFVKKLFMRKLLHYQAMDQIVKWVIKQIIEEPSPQLCNTSNADFHPDQYSFTELLSDSGDAGNCLDGVARAVQVLNASRLVRAHLAPP